jgi:hypothetical protein
MGDSVPFHETAARRSLAPPRGGSSSFRSLRFIEKPIRFTERLLSRLAASIAVFPRYLIKEEGICGACSVVPCQLGGRASKSISGFWLKVEAR